MTPSLLSELRRHLMASPFKGEEELVFSTPRGTPLDGNNLVRRDFKPALRRAGLPQIRFHDLRHSFASLLIAQGEHPKLISEQLGHASVQITLDRYGHLMPQSYDHAGERLEAALFGSTPAVNRPRMMIEFGRPDLTENVLALTFDDGPSRWTPAILELLSLHQARATFFVTGRWANSGRTYLSRSLTTITRSAITATATARPSSSARARPRFARSSSGRAT
jgi:hypothetical protein